MRRALAAIATSIATLMMIACGGGGGSSSYTALSTPTTPITPVSISTPQVLPATVAGKSYATTLQAIGGTAPYTWSAGSSFPAWLAIDAKTGVISGTVPIPNPAWNSQQYALNVKVTDSATPATSATAALLLNADGQITISPTTAAGGTRSVPYSWNAVLNGGQPPFTVTVDSGLPPGLQLSASLTNNFYLTVQGTPTTAGTYTAQVRVKDSAATPQEVVLPLPFTIDSKLAVANTSLKTIVSGRPYSYQLTAVNGTPPFTWTQRGLPSGITIDSATGLISGTTSFAGGDGGVFITVKDSSSPSQTASGPGLFYVTGALEFRVSGPLQGNVNTPMIQGVVSLGGIQPTKMTSSGTLPPGVTFDPYGDLTGTPTTTGTYSFAVSATDSDTPPVTIQNSFTLTIYTPLPVLGDLFLPHGAVNHAYSAQLYARDGTLPYHWSLASGTLPSGLSLSDSGTITGTPTSISSSTFQVKGTDSASPAQSGNHSYSIVIAAQPKGRNDSIATATPLTGPFASVQGTFSPYADPPDSTTSAPDTDYYSISEAAGAKVSITVPSSSIVDPVIEILDANGQRYKTCNDPGDDNPTLTFIVKDATPTAFDDECLNDDIDPTVNRTAHLDFLVPGTAGSQLKFYIHVFDASGNARPDMTYSMSVNTTGP